ncbi:MAG: T9SS type A sorting domain-containing protein [Tannerella sp.]|nr:T9SS type A sorting domain-containing protein [Tannerella sp.]
MNLKISLLSVGLLTMSVCADAQTARNPLNREPASIALQKGISSWKLANEIFYHADGTQFDKRSLMYDENGQKTSDITQRWNEDDKSWQNASKSETIYGENKEVVISSVQNMTGWQKTSKVENVYGPEGRLAYSYSYSWNNNADDWFVDPSMRCEWIYDESGRVTEYLKQHMNKATGEWNDYDTRILYSYDGEGNLKEEIYQSWNSESESWTSGGKYTYSKDSERKKVAMSYICVSDKWVFDGKTIYSYDEEGKLARCEYYGNNTDESLNAYCIYTYSESVGTPVVLETKDINVYPNPVVLSFELTVPDVFVGKIANLFDVSGKLVKSMLISDEKTQVDVAGLSSGIYILKVSDKTKKLVIK